jgi:GT2 family glycosyltransferase
MASISVIIPAYNRAGLIGETLRSLLNQTLPAKEIIVVDDGSRDGTAQAVEREFSVFSEQFSAKSNTQNPTFKILRQQNAGPGAARNRGLAEAMGEFVHFFDSDDIASPNKHEVQLRAILETGADIAYGPWGKGWFLPLEKLKESLTTDDSDVHGWGELGSCLGKLSGAAFSNPSTSELARDCENTSPTRSANDASAAEEYSSSLPIRDIRGSNFSLPRNFVPEEPVLQARGLPQGDLVRALLTNWSIVPHACLFRRSILERAGGFPEDIWVGEDQLLFLRCLLAGAQVVHTPETMVFYRLGDDPGKLTATGAAQKRHAKDWARFLVRAQEEVSSAGTRVPAEARKRGGFLTTDDTGNHGYQKNQQGNAQGACAGAAFLSPSTSELARASESLASGRSTFDSSTPPAEWHGFRLRAYEAWRDLETFFPFEESELKNNLQGIWKRNWFSGFRFQVSGFVLRKLGGLKLRVLGYRENSSFRCGKFSVFGGERCVALHKT